MTMPRLRAGAISIGVLALACGCNGPAVPTASAPPAGPRLAWLFAPPERGAVVAAPRPAGEFVYAVAVRDFGLGKRGAVYCLRRANGKVVWTFDDGGAMQHGISCPCVADGRVYVGEGMHANFVCKLYCLDAGIGKKLWDFEAAGHIESSPAVADGVVYFGSGDDGLFALDAVTGKERWHVHGPWHIDAGPVVSGGMVFIGSGTSRRLSTHEFLCLNAVDGKILWRVPTGLPVWGSAATGGGRVYVPLGNGRLTNSDAQPAGALVCLDAGSGEQRWRRELPDGVLAAPALDEARVFVNCRDGRCRAFDRQTGEAIWAVDLGSPVVTAPALASGGVFVVADQGRVARFDAATGREIWRYEVAARTQTAPQMFSSPRAAVEGGRVRLYFGAELKGGAGSEAAVFCLED